MVKLVRLESDSILTESQFTNNMSMALNIGKNGKVAIKTLSMQFDKPLINIDDTNNTFSFKTGIKEEDTTQFVTISNGFYTPEDLLGQINARMNNNLDSINVGNSNDINFEWRITPKLQNNELYTSMEFSRLDPAVITNAEVRLDSMTYTQPNFFKSSPVNDGSYNAELYTNYVLCRGGFYLGTNIVSMSADPENDVSQSRWMLFLDANRETVDEADEDDMINLMVCGVMVDSTGHYAYKKNGVMVSTPLTVQAGDSVLIGKHLEAFQYKITQGTQVFDYEGDDVNAFAQSTGNNKLYYGLKVGNDTGKVGFTNLITTKSPFYTEVNGVHSEIDTVPEVIRNTNLITASESKVVVNFPSSVIRNTLGFDKASYTATAVSGSFISENALSLNTFNNDIVVEVLQLNVNTYDHTYKQLRNIVMVITSGEVKKAISAKGTESYELSYTDSYPTYLNVGNPQSIMQVPQLTIRVSSGGATLPMNGKMSCCLLIADENDINA